MEGQGGGRVGGLTSTCQSVLEDCLRCPEGQAGVGRGAEVSEGKFTPGCVSSSASFVPELQALGQRVEEGSWLRMQMSGPHF